MSVEPSPPWMTSAPCDAAPRPSASASGALLARMSCSVTMLFAFGQPDERRADRFGDAFVKLVRNDAPDVVCLEDLVQIAHSSASSSLIPSPAASLASQDQPIGRRHRARGAQATYGRHGCGGLWVAAGLGLGRGERSGRRAGGRGGRPRRPGRPARRRRRAGRAACRGWHRRGRGGPGRPPARPASRTTFASASRSSARSCAGSGGSRTTSQPRGTTSRAACFSHKSHECGST